MHIAKKLENIQCRFLSDDDDENHKFHIFQWEEIKKPIKCGGLGIRSIVDLNVALQGKWLWH